MCRKLRTQNSKYKRVLDAMSGYFDRLSVSGSVGSISLLSIGDSHETTSQTEGSGRRDNEIPSDAAYSDEARNAGSFVEGTHEIVRDKRKLSASVVVQKPDQI